jgi:hypothetical protein
VENIIHSEYCSVRNQAVGAVTIPEFQPSTAATGEVDLDPNVVTQLRMYVTILANLYRNNNAFHNFEHASHVIIPTVKAPPESCRPKREEEKYLYSERLL